MWYKLVLVGGNWINTGIPIYQTAKPADDTPTVRYAHYLTV